MIHGGGSKSNTLHICQRPLTTIDMHTKMIKDELHSTNFYLLLVLFIPLETIWSNNCTECSKHSDLVSRGTSSVPRHPP